MRKHWCRQHGLVPHTLPKGKTVPLALYMFVAGLFTCGITWMLMLFLPIVILNDMVQPPVCPVCGLPTKPATDAQIQGDVHRLNLHRPPEDTHA